MQIDPAACGIAVRRTECLDSLPRRPRVIRGDFIESDAFKPRTPVKGTAITDVQNDLVARPAGDELEIEPGPSGCAAERRGVHVEWHGRHGQSGARRDG